MNNFETQMGDMHTQMGDMQTQMGDMQTQMGDMKTNIYKIFELLQAKNLGNSSQNVESDKKAEEDPIKQQTN